MNDRMSDMDALVELAARAMCTDAAHIHRGRAATVRCGWHTEQARAALLAVGLPALLERVEAAERREALCEKHSERDRRDIDQIAGERDRAIAERDALAAKVADDSLIVATAKASWDRGERDYWDHESDMRPFDPSVTELDGDDCDRGREWLEIVTEVIADFRTALDASETP